MRPRGHGQRLPAGADREPRLGPAPRRRLTLGDNQYNSGLLSEYTGAGAYGATWGIFNPIVYPDPGNHEYSASSSAAGYFAYFGGATHGSTAGAPYYSFNLGTWHLISLDSSCSNSGCGDLTAGQTTSAQTSWLQSDLAAHPAACTLAYWHHPRFSTSWTNDSPGIGAAVHALSTTRTPTSSLTATTTSTSVTPRWIRPAPRHPTACVSSSPGQVARACSAHHHTADPPGEDARTTSECSC